MTEKEEEDSDFNDEEIEIDAQDCCSDSSDHKKEKEKSGRLFSVEVEKPFINLNEYLKRNPQTSNATAIDLPLVTSTKSETILKNNDPKTKTNYLVSAEKTQPLEKRKFAVPKFNLATQDRRASAFKPRETEQNKPVESVSVSFGHKLDFPFFHQNLSTTSQEKSMPLELNISQPNLIPNTTIKTINS